MTSRLDKLTQEGWDCVGYYADLEIFAREGRRALYDKKRDEVILEYDFRKEVREAEGAERVWKIN